MDDKSTALIERLEERTKAGKVSWEKTETDGVYQAAFPGYSVRVSTEEVKGQWNKIVDSYTLALFDKEGSLIEEFAETVEEEYGDEPLAILYHAARRRAMGYEQAVESLLQALAE